VIRDLLVILQIMAMLSIILSYREIWTRIAHTYALVWSRSRGSHHEPWTYADTVDAFLLRRVADDERKARTEYPQAVSKNERDRILAVCEMRRELVRLYRKAVDDSSPHSGAYLTVVRLTAGLYEWHPDFKQKWIVPRGVAAPLS
jgi:Family of unknown function (DUF6221)